MKNALPETPAFKQSRFQSQLGLTEYDASVIIGQGPELTAYFETVSSNCGDGKTAANWVTQEILRDLNATNTAVGDFAVTSEVLGNLLKLIVDERITNKSARDVYAILKERAADGEALSLDMVEKLAAEREIVNDTGALETAITAAIAAQPAAVADVKEGKMQAIGPMMGMIMKQVAGADPKTVRQMLIKMIQDA